MNGDLRLANQGGRGCKEMIAGRWKSRYEDQEVSVSSQI